MGKKTNDLKFDDIPNFDNRDESKLNESSGQYDDGWKEYIDYYRQYIDKFCVEVLGLKLHFFQRLILRAMSKHQYTMLICCRGLGKSWLSAVFFVASCILYKGLKCGIASGQGQQARNVIIQKIQGELANNPAIKREIVFPIKTGASDCVCAFKNGAEIRAIVLGRNGGDGARSWRFNYLLIDEARLVQDSVVSTILIPMTKTKRPIAIEHNEKEKGKVIFISSAFLKTSDLYKRFKYFCEKMQEGNKNYFVCALDYKVGIEAGIFDEEDIMEERNKPDTTEEIFQYEYCGVFVGSSGDSYYPYELTNPQRTIEMPELEQPKKSKSEYIIVHDVALSKANNSDNACTHVIKLKERSDGTYYKDIVFTKTHNGSTLPEQMNFLRELYHLKFPNAIKIVIDKRGNGEPLPSLFYCVWEYKNPKTGEIVEYPPLVLDDDIEGMKLNGAIPLIRGISATNSSNNSMYTYCKASFENGTLRLLKHSAEKDQEYKLGEIKVEEFQNFIQTDLMISELSNIKQEISEKGNIMYTRIVANQKRDRATSLIYGLSIVNEMEDSNRKNKLSNKEDNWEDYFLF